MTIPMLNRSATTRTANGKLVKIANGTSVNGN